MQGKAIYLSADQNSFESYYIYWFSIKFQYVITNTELKQLWWWQRRQLQKTIDLMIKTTALHVHHAFSTFLWYRWQFMVLLWKIPIKWMQAARIFTHLPAWKQKLSLQSGLALGASIIPVSSVSWCKVWKTQSGFNFLAGNPAL